MFYTYVLLSEKDRKFYTGFTDDLKLRLREHKRGAVESTRDRRPLKLVYYEACLDEQDAIERKIFQNRFRASFLDESFRTVFEK